jgi:hypothetical protein
LIEKMMLKLGPDQYGQRVSRNEEYYTNSQSNSNAEKRSQVIGVLMRKMASRHYH